MSKTSQWGIQEPLRRARSSASPCDACHWGVFCQTVTATDEGYPRQLNSILGTLRLTSGQAEQLEVSAHSRLSPYLELCCLRQSAVMSYQKAQVEVEVQTGRRVSAKTQQRLGHRQSFPVPVLAGPIEQMSLDGGMIRLRTPKGEASEWREYKALNVGEEAQGMAWFKDNESLLAWANGLPFAATVDCLRDGHDGVWGLYAQMGTERQRPEIFDWYHLVENLHRVSATSETLETVRSWWWQGQVEAAMDWLKAEDTESARRFCGYLQRHRARLPNYRYYQAEGGTIGSGDVESLVKQINQRTKLAGASWNDALAPEQYFST